MGVLMEKKLADSANLLESARVGDREALNSLLDRYRDRLRRMVEMRLDTRLQARFDASDVVQDAYVDVAERLAEYLRDPKLPLFLWLAADRRRAADEVAPTPPRHSDARRRPRSVAVSRCLAGGQLRGAGSPVAGPAHLSHPGSPASRTHPALAGGAEHARPDGPGDPFAAALRGADRGRDGSRSGNRGVGRGQTLLPCSQAPQGDPRRNARWAGRDSDMADDSSERFVMLNHLADEFADRYRRGERPALQEYIDRHPELADDIREFFPAMVEMEQVKEDREEVTEPPTSGQLPPPGRLGDYRIIREIGRGGMGVVYEAEQVSLGRHVALKVLPKNRLLDAKTQCRFEREAKSAAKLHHTNIVPVFGFGEQDGMPYYVMQFIQGLGLDEVLDELKKLQLGNAKAGAFADGELCVARNVGQVSQPAGEAEGRSGNLPHGELSAAQVARSLLTGEFERTRDSQYAEDALQEREVVTGAKDQGSDARGSTAVSDSFMLSSSSVVLPGQGRDGSKSKSRKLTYWQSVASIGAQVADALEYAHKQGINHRDIKPSNLLLDTQGTVWVTDFGLAKVDDQKNLTQTGDVLGTLRYMPPEAFEGKTDARSDVYSLGLTLYEMLAFRSAFDERERNRLIKQVIHDEPTRLGLVNRAVPRDLATIVHKAIDRDSARRYATAADLAADLQRFLDDEPIKARRISGFERLARWSRHHPGVATSLAVIGLLVMTGLAGLGIGLVRFREQAQVQTALAADRDGETAKAVEARVQAETARRKLALALTDMHTSQGVVAGQRDEPAQAVLWFANAVRLAREDPERQRLNRIRARTWARGAFTPIHGFRRAGGYGAFEQFAFHPGGRYLLVQKGSQDRGARFPKWIEYLGP